jgi:hypothetical protein
MSSGSPGDDSGGEPAAPQDPWSQPADFGQPGSAATPVAQPAQPAPPPSEPGGFSSGAPQDWSASTPASWNTPEPAQPAQPAQPAPPTRSPPPGPGPSGPPPWPGTTDASASPQPAGNGFSAASSDPWAAQPPAYQPPAGPYSYQSTYYTPNPTRTNRLAIAALVCGVTQFFLGLFALNFLLAIPATICGAIGLRQTRERGEGGRGLSIAGLVLGILGIVWNVLYVVLIVAIANRT